MLFPVQCRCGYPIGAVYDAINERKRLAFLEHIKNEKIDIEAKNISRTPIDLELVKVFEDYKIKNSCCRARLISNVNMHDMLF